MTWATSGAVIVARDGSVLWIVVRLLVVGSMLAGVLLAVRHHRGAAPAALAA